jgi:hypothetical protein
MPSKSAAQAKLMNIAAHTKGGYGGVPQAVGKEFVNADKKKDADGSKLRALESEIKEIEAEIQKIEAERAKKPKVEKPVKELPKAKEMTDEDWDNYYRSTGWATGDYGQYRDQKTDSKEQKVEIEEEKPTLGSKIKSFFGFNK